MSSDIETIVKNIIIDKLGVDENEVTNQASFSYIGADSLDTVELIMEFEQTFGIKIPDEEAEKIGTVGEVISYIEKISKNDVFLKLKIKEFQKAHDEFLENSKKSYWYISVYFILGYPLFLGLFFFLIYKFKGFELFNNWIFGFLILFCPCIIWFTLGYLLWGDKFFPDIDDISN